MEILCIMGLFPENYENTIIKNSKFGIQNAANKLQWAIVDGLVQQNKNVHIANSLYIGSFPKKYKKILIPSFPFKFNGKEIGFNAGFLNLPIIKIFSRYYGLKKRIDHWHNSVDKEKVIIAYAMTSPMVELLNYVKKKYPTTLCVLIVPDLPEYMNLSPKTKLYSFVRKHHIKHLKKHLRSIDGYVFLTDYMKEWFEYNVEYTVIEGVYRKTDSQDYNVKKEKIILYSGGLSEEYGVLELVKCFQKTKISDWKLELIGDGNLIQPLKEIANKDARIIVTGVLPNEQVIKRQKQASILINPRRSNQEFTKYSFPSKTIEYMASGTVMAGYKLPGIPDEYYEYMYEIPDTENGLFNCLNELMNKSEHFRNEMGARAKLFIQTKKNSNAQCDKIIKLINKVNQNKNQVI